MVPQTFPEPILFAIGGLGRGGSEVQLTRLLKHLGPELTGATLFVCDAGEDALIDEVTHAGVRPLRVPRAMRAARTRAPATAAMALAAVVLQRPRLIYAWLEESTFWLVPCAMLTRVPIVIARRNLQGSGAEAQHRLVAGLQRWLERRATLVTANSEAVAAAARDRGIDPARIRMVRNGHEPAEPLPLPVGPMRTFGYLANFRPEKGHRMLLDALEAMPREPEWRVLCGGGGPLRELFASEARRRGLEDRIDYAMVDDARAFWAQCDVAVLLSDQEGSPNALIEAAFAGRPLVATAVGGSGELIPEGAGHLVMPGDAAGAATALASLITADADTLKAMGHRAWEHASSRFGVATMVAGHRAVLVEAGRRTRS
jgi:glycosyltransferase involved in cell wall biosynthesis